MQSDRVQFLKVTPNKATIFSTGNRGNRGRVVSERSKSNLKYKGYNGYMSRATQSKVISMLQAWIYTIDGRKAQGHNPRYKQRETIQFITLTLPATQFHDDKFLKRHLLNPMLQDLKRLHGLEHHFWRAEPQNQGNIHFHLLTELKLHYQVLRDLWNKHLDRLGYIELYRKNQKFKHRNGFWLDKSKLKHWPADKQYKAYLKGVREDWSDPNSTDIRKVKGRRSALAYVAKYCVKNEIGRSIEGRIWGSSDELKLLKWSSMPYSQFEMLDLLRLTTQAKVQRYEGDHFECYWGWSDFAMGYHAPSLARRVNADIARFDLLLRYGPSMGKKEVKHRQKPPDLQLRLALSAAYDL